MRKGMATKSSSRHMIRSHELKLQKIKTEPKRDIKNRFSGKSLSSDRGNSLNRNTPKKAMKSPKTATLKTKMLIKEGSGKKSKKILDNNILSNVYMENLYEDKMENLQFEINKRNTELEPTTPTSSNVK